MKNCQPLNKTLALVIAFCFFMVVSWTLMPPHIQAAGSGTQISAGSDDQPNYIVKESTSRQIKKKNRSLLPLIVAGGVILTVVLVLLLTKKKGGDDSVTVTEFGGHGTGDGLFDHPSGIALDGSGNVYVSDHNNQRIQKFTANGVFIKKWNFSPGLWPLGLTVYGNRLYVCDNHFGTSNIQVYDLDGVHLDTWSVKDYNTRCGTPIAVDVDADSSGNIYVLDNINRMVVIFNSSGTVKGHFSDIAGNESNGCNGIAISGNQIFITDGDTDPGWNGSRVNVFDLSGNFIRTWGGSGSGPGKFNAPIGVAIMNGDSVIVGDINSSPTFARIQKFDFSGSYQSVIQPAQGGFYPRAMAVNDKAGKIYVCAGSGDNILVVDTF